MKKTVTTKVEKTNNKNSGSKPATQKVTKVTTVQPDPHVKPKKKKVYPNRYKYRSKGGRKVVEPDGSTSNYTAKELDQIAKSGQELPSNYVRLLSPNSITISNNLNAQDGVIPNWELVAQLILHDIAARHPHRKPPTASGWAGAKQYLCWQWLSRMRLERHEAIVGTDPTRFSKTVFPDFSEDDLAVPVAWAIFVESWMPFFDPQTGARYKYQIDFDQFFVDNGGVYPNISGGAITNFAASNDYWNRSINLSCILLEQDVTNGQEICFNAPAGGSNALVFQNKLLYSDFFKQTGTWTTAKSIPHFSSDGSGYAFVSAAASLYPGIYSNTTKFDAEYAFMFHSPTNPQTNSNTSQTFRHIVPIPTVLFDIYPIYTQLGSLPSYVTCSEAQVAMVANYVSICAHCSYYGNNSRPKVLSTCQNIYKGLRSFSPNYYNLDLNMFHQLVEQIAIQVQQLTTQRVQPDSVSGNPGTGGAPYCTFSDYVWFFLGCEFHLLSRTMKFAWPSLIFYANTDTASSTAYANVFASLAVPALVADYVQGIGPVVMHGVRCVPLYDYRPASYIEPLASFRGLPVNYDHVNGRWMNIINPQNALDSPGNVTLPQVYSPSTVAPSAGTTPTSKDRSQPFAFGAYVTTAGATVFLNLAGGAVYGFNYTNYIPGFPGAAPVTPISAAANYLPLTPNRLASNMVRSFEQFMMATFQNNIPAENVNLGNLAQISPVVLNKRNASTQSLRLGSTITSSATAIAVALQLEVVVGQLGSQLPLDESSVARVLVHCYRVAGFVNHMPYMFTNNAETQPFAGLIATTVRSPGQTNVFLDSWQANRLTMHGCGPMEILRTTLIELFDELVELDSRPLEVGRAAAIVTMAMKHIHASPYALSIAKNLSVFHSPNGVAKAVMATKGLGGTLKHGAKFGAGLFKYIFS